MTPTLTQVRQALCILAQRKCRPDYELCTAKQVKFAVDNGLDHPLTEELRGVDSGKNDSSRHYASQESFTRKIGKTPCLSNSRTGERHS